MGNPARLPTCYTAPKPPLVDLDPPAGYRLDGQIVVAIAQEGIPRYAVKRADDGELEGANPRASGRDGHGKRYPAKDRAVAQVYSSHTAERDAAIPIHITATHRPLHRHHGEPQDV